MEGEGAFSSPRTRGGLPARVVATLMTVGRVDGVDGKKIREWIPQDPVRRESRHRLPA